MDLDKVSVSVPAKDFISLLEGSNKDHDEILRLSREIEGLRLIQSETLDRIRELMEEISSLKKNF